MKNATVLMIALFCITAITAQRKVKGNGKVVTIERSMGDYDALRIGGFYEVELTEGPEGTITLQGEENLLEYIETEVAGGTLIVKTKNRVNLRPSRGKRVYITVPIQSIDAIRLSGSGKLHSSTKIQSDDFILRTSGSRNLDLDLESEALILTTSGSSTVRLQGNTQTLNITSSGSSHIDCYGMAANVVDAESSGSSNIKVLAKEGIKARTSGSSNIRYTGDPAKIDSKASGSGKIAKKR